MYNILRTRLPENTRINVIAVMIAIYGRFAVHRRLPRKSKFNYAESRERNTSIWIYYLQTMLQQQI